MINSSILSDKRIKNPIYYLWTKWNQPTQEGQDANSWNIFGTPLEETAQYNEHGLSIPTTVQLCFTEIVARGLETEGLFRLSGATSEVVQLQQAFEEQQQQQQQAQPINLSCYDIHSITSFIKKYLHHLPTAVIPVDYHHDFLRLATLSTEHALPMLMDLIVSLPEQHRDLFRAILLLSSHIQRYAHINMMNPEALAVILAPVCTGLEKTIQILPKKTAKRNKKLQQHRYYHYQQRLNTQDIQQLIETNARWTLLWKWMIENHERILLSTSTAIMGHTKDRQPFNSSNTRSMPSLRPQQNKMAASPSSDSSIVGSPEPPPPVPSLLFWSCLATTPTMTTKAAETVTEGTKGLETKPQATRRELHANNNSSNSLISSSAIESQQHPVHYNQQQHHHHHQYPYDQHNPSSPPRASSRHLNKSSSKINLKTKSSRQSLLSSCQKSSHGILRRLASVSSLR
ncbi:Rho GTPase activation protein [Absidia repens]|uniref:Rho GTPase activation protein n=1 Tax=Absidia repens TaxID=90262 RepID=A0A1X2I8X3_9FUNG|nr:Rho GTPase activation protein [Absidia repens]